MTSKSNNIRHLASEKTAAQVVSVSAPAKINLYFDILNKRADNYHEILTLFQALSLKDTLTFKFFDDASSNNIEIYLQQANESVESKLFPLDKDNSIYKAVEIFLSALPEVRAIKVKIEVEKNIPIGAGLAGGSADAAATLLALNKYFNQPFANEKLLQLASQIGSDVSFCLSGGLAVGRGRGEHLEQLVINHKYHFVLVKPRSISVSTAWAYRTYDQSIRSESNEEIQPHSISNILLSLKFESDIEKHAQHFWNAFEEIIFQEQPILKKIKERLLELGSIAAHLTGSGPTIFALVKDAEDGQRILKSIQSKPIRNLASVGKTNEVLDAWLCESIDNGAQILPYGSR